MTSARAKQIGIDRPVRLAWLERTSSLVLASNSPQDVKAILQDELRGTFRSGNTEVRGSLDKTITILMKVWLKAPRELTSLRVAGLDLLKQMPKQDRMPIHWGMVMAVYPFWASVASQVGRLLKLQATVRASQVQRRMREQYGERETVSRRTRYVLRSFVDWNVIRETAVKGEYEPEPAFAVNNKELAVWLIEAVMFSRFNGHMSLKSFVECTSLFPFRIKQVSAEEMISASSRLDVVRHNLDDELVILKNPH